MAFFPSARRPLRFLVLSARGKNTGSEIRARKIAQALRDLGHFVVYAPPIPTLRFWLDMALSTFWYLPFSLRGRFDAALAVKPYPTVIPALFLTRILGARWIFDIDDLDFTYSRTSWFRAFHRLLQAPWPKRADFVTCHNRFLFRDLPGIFQISPKRLVLLPQGVDETFLRPESANPRKKPLPKKKNRPLIVFCAHLTAVSCALEEVLQAFQHFLKKMPSAHLRVVGGGTDLPRFRRLAAAMRLSAQVHFTGEKPPDFVRESLLEADLVWVYYRNESSSIYRSSLKLREALACGAKVVATPFGEIHDWRRYLFCAPPDPSVFAKASLQALKAKPRPSARKILTEQWSWKTCVKLLVEKLYELP